MSLLQAGGFGQLAPQIGDDRHALSGIGDADGHRRAPEPSGVVQREK